MQKVQSYLYPNRIILLADLAGFTVENRVVYARTVKIYQGIDNVIQFDIQNADQKRIDLTTLTDIEVNVMDAGGKSLINSPYFPVLYGPASATNATVVTPIPVAATSTATIIMPTSSVIGTFLPTYQLLGTNIVGPVMISGVTQSIDAGTTTLTVTFNSQTLVGGTGFNINSIIKGLATITIPQEDLDDLDEQYLTFSVTALDQLGNNIMLYSDSNFNAAGTFQLIGNAMPKFRDETVYDEFTGEINYLGSVINHTAAIPCKFYEAEATQCMSFSVNMTNFIGTVYIEATEDMTISIGSFTTSVTSQIQTWSTLVPTTTTITFMNVPVLNPTTGKNWNYMRVSWKYPDVWQYGSQQNPLLTLGYVSSVTVIS
jgi:hypothetical protein